MDLKKLSQFLAIVEAGSLSRAAVRLHIAQPALTHAVQSLEEELGVPLLERHARGVKLTELGTVLADQARVVLREVERARALIRERISNPSGGVRLAVPPVLSGGISGELLFRLGKRLPGVSATVIERDALLTREAVLSGACDAALTYAPEADGDVALRPLVVEELSVAVQKGTFARRRKLSIREIEHLEFVLLPKDDPIRVIIDETVRRHGVRLNVIAELGGLADLLGTVESGKATILPPFAALRSAVGRIDVLPLYEPRLPCCMFMMTARHRNLPRTASAFQDVVLSTIEGLIRRDAWPGRYVGHLPSTASMISIFTNRR